MNPHDLTLPSHLWLHPVLDRDGGELVTALAAAPASAGMPPSGLAEVTRRLAASAPRWRSSLGAAPGRTQLARTVGLELWLVAWAPGAAAQAHDHGGAAVALTVLDGALVEDCLDATIWTTCRRTTFRAGSTAAFPPGHVHRLAAAGGAPATSVHAWSPRRPTRQPLAAGTPRIGTVERCGSLAVRQLVGGGAEHDPEQGPLAVGADHDHAGLVALGEGE